MQHALQESHWLPGKHLFKFPVLLFYLHMQMKSLEIFLRPHFGGVNKALERTLINADSGHVLRKAELDNCPQSLPGFSPFLSQALCWS